MPEHIKENELRLNQVVKKEFASQGEPLQGQSLYIIEAMLWGIEQNEVREAFGSESYTLQDGVGKLLGRKPATVLAYLYPDTDVDGKYHELGMDEEADEFDGQSIADIATRLLENLKTQMDYT